MSWLNLLAENAWKGTVVLSAAIAASVILRRAPAALRHLVWTAAFTALLALPVLTLQMPRAASLPVFVPASREAVRVMPGPARPTGPATNWNLVPLVWWCGWGASAVWFLIGALRTSWMVRRSTVATYADIPDLGRRMRVLQCAEVSMPVTWGILRPVVLLPPDAASWPPARLRSVLLHEFMHVRRKDVLAQCIAQAACCLYWFHPAAWFALRQLRKEREQACDDAVLLHGIAAHEYAGHLVDLVRGMARRRSEWSAAPGMAEVSDLEARVRALLDRGRRRGPVTRRAAAAVVAGVFAVMLPIASITAYAQGRGALVGTVEDPSGARVPRCEVSAVNLDGVNREVTRSNLAGEYSFASIPPGRYALEFRMPGFATLKMQATVAAGVPTRTDASLDVGSVSESMAVRAKRAQPAARSNVPAQRIRVGGNVQATKLISRVPPEYPADLHAAGVEGTVVLRAVVSKTGDLADVTPVNTNVHPGLVKAALDAVRQWRYQPTLLNGEPVEVVTTITVDFILE